MNRFLTRAILGSLALAAPAGAQRVLPFPMRVLDLDVSREEVRLAPRLDIIAELAAPELQASEQVLLIDVLLPDGHTVDLELVRISVERRAFGFRVDGRERPDLLQGLDLSLWSGVVAGERDSTVMLSFSNTGCSGWIARSGQLVHVIARPDDTGSWVDGDVLFTTEASLNRQGRRLEFGCDARPAPGQPVLPPVPPVDPGPPQASGGDCSTRECRVAVETDYQLFEVFGDLNAMTAYITTLLSFVSERYANQADTVITYPYLQFYTDPDDPWDSQDQGGNCVDVLYEFRAAWAGNIPGEAHLGHFLSGAKLGCGVAWVAVLCNDNYGFAVSGNINGGVQFPVQQQPNNWDFMVVAHELGHNFGTWHTHDYCPPLDECAPDGYWGSCQDEQICITDGTIMSYCHLCPGGTGNITTYFHPTVADVITVGAQQCLPGYVKLEGDPPQLLPPKVATSVGVQFQGQLVGDVELLYRYNGGQFVTIPMTDKGGGLYRAFLPGAGCNDRPEFYFTYMDAVCGQVRDPKIAPAALYAADVGIPDIQLTDDFESDLGWTTENQGATGGQWERGVPVDDPGWAYDPASDFDGSGQCWLTQNDTGNTDVDNGATALLSPIFDMSGGEAFISYAYYLYLDNEDGTDGLLVEINSKAGAGVWHEIARHDTSGGTGWREHAIGPDALKQAGVGLTNQMLLRFTANDGDPQSIVEVAIDAFQLAYLACESLGTNYCGPANLNSDGGSAVIMAIGSPVVADNDVTLTAMNMPPNKLGYFLTSTTQGFVPFVHGSDGNLCLGGIIGRYANQIQDSGSASWFSIKLDLGNMPPLGTAVAPGETWNFQAWFRDENPTPTSNFTDGASVLFQ